MITGEILIHELQLGNKLSASVHEERRQDFALMLSMLVGDVREHSQFHLPTTETNPENTDELMLRKRFNLPAKAPLAIESVNDYERANQAELTTDSNLTEIRLKQALQPMPLAELDDKYKVRSEVVANTSAYCQFKTKQQTNKPLNETRAMDVGLLLSTIKASQLHSAVNEQLSQLSV